MIIEQKDIFVAGIISGLTEEAQISFNHSMGGKGNPAFVAIFNEETNQTAIAVIERLSSIDKSKITFADIENLVLADPKDIKISMTEQDGKWHKADSSYPYAGALWQIELLEV